MLKKEKDRHEWRSSLCIATPQNVPVIYAA